MGKDYPLDLSDIPPAPSTPSLSINISIDDLGTSKPKLRGTLDFQIPVEALSPEALTPLLETVMAHSASKVAKTLVGEETRRQRRLKGRAIGIGTPFGENEHT